VRFFVIPASALGVIEEAEDAESAMAGASVVPGEYVVVPDDSLPRFRVVEETVRNVEPVE
jgi:hypothetical protein